jgi:hypothetical protein
MGYNPYSESTLTPDEMFEEKNRLVRMIRSLTKDDPLKLSQNDLSFVNKMSHASSLTVNQLFYLRDIKDKL